MRNYFRYFIYLYVFIGFSAVKAGSFDEFFMAVKRDDAVAVENLLRRGFDPNTPNSDGQFGLYLALREPSLRVARLLIDWPQTRVETRNRADESARMMAALKGQGVRLIDEAPRLGAHHTRIAFLHPKASGGVLTELCEPGE